VIPLGCETAGLRGKPISRVFFENLADHRENSGQRACPGEARRRGAHTLIDLVGEIKDLAEGTTFTNVRDNVNIKLSDATAADLAKRPVEYDTDLRCCRANT